MSDIMFEMNEFIIQLLLSKLKTFAILLLAILLKYLLPFAPAGPGVPFPPPGGPI